MKRALVKSFGGYGRMVTLVMMAAVGGMALAWSTASAAQRISEEFGQPSGHVMRWLAIATLLLVALCLLAAIAYLATRLLEMALRLRSRLADDAWAEVRRVAESAPDCETAERWLGGAERLAKLSRRAGLPVGNCQAWLAAVQTTLRQAK